MGAEAVAEALLYTATWSIAANSVVGELGAQRIAVTVPPVSPEQHSDQLLPPSVLRIIPPLFAKNIVWWGDDRSTRNARAPELGADPGSSL